MAIKIRDKKNVIKFIRLKGWKWKEVRILDEIGRERGRQEERQGWAGLQTRCSQAHTSSLCNDLLSVGILFRSNRLLQKKKKEDDSVWFFSLWTIYDIAGALKWSQTLFQREAYSFKILPAHKAHPGATRFSEHLSKLLVWNIGEKNRGVECWMLRLALLFSYYLKACRLPWMMHGTIHQWRIREHVTVWPFIQFVTSKHDPQQEIYPC